MIRQILEQEIQKEGPLSLARYMALSLYHEHYGYYRTKNPLGRAGDFVTAPGLTSLFGEVLAISLATNAFQKGYVHADVVEFGGGNGTQMLDVLKTLQKVGHTGKAHMVETSPTLRKEQQKRVQAFDVQWHETIETLPNDAPLLMISNEFFDALPVDQYFFTQGQWHSMCVGLEDGRFIWHKKKTKFVPPASYSPPQEGNFYEHPAMGMSCFRSLMQRLKGQGGLFLTIDYGYDGWAYGNTLQAMKNHKFLDPLESPGDCDLTTHVNFSMLEAIAREEDLEPLPLLTQRDFLLHYGILERYERLLKVCSPKTQKAMASALDRLIDPKQMGTLFKALIVVN